MVRNKTAPAEDPKREKKGPDFSTEDYTIEIFSKRKSLHDLETIVRDWTRQDKSSNRENSLVITGRVSKPVKGYGTTSFEFSDRFFAVLHRMSEKGFSYPDMESLKELHLQQPGGSSWDHAATPVAQRNKASTMVPDVCQLEPDVFCKVDWVDNYIGEEATRVDYSIKVYSAVLSVEDLAKMLDKWLQEYENHKHEGTGLKYFVYNPPKEDQKDRKTHCLCSTQESQDCPGAL